MNQRSDGKDGGPLAGRERSSSRTTLRDQRKDARLRKDAEKQKRAADQHRLDMRVQRQTSAAVVRTEQVDQKLQRLTTLLLASLSRTVKPIDFEELKQAVPMAKLGADREPLPAPLWEEFAPKPPRLAGKLLHAAKHRQALAVAEEAYARALERHKVAEAERQARVNEKVREHEGQTAGTKARISAHNRSIDSLRQRVLARDPFAVGEYYERVFADIVDKRPFPRGRRIAYVPDSKLLLIDWQLPSVDVVPKEKEFRYNKAVDAIEVSKLRTVEELDETYDELVAQIALRTVNTALAADPDQLVDTVVFNGLAVSPTPTEGSDFDAGPCLFSMRAGRRTFAKLKLADVEPLDRVKKVFAARISDRPDELQEIEPVLAFEEADPRTTLQPDSSPFGPDLMAMSVKELEQIAGDLLSRMGFEHELVRSSPEGMDYRAARMTSDGEERFLVHLRRTTKPIPPQVVRDLVSSVRREKADEGLLLSTAGILPATFEYANGKPVTLHSRQTLLALLRRNGVRARIEHAPATALKSQPARVPMPKPRVPGLPPVRTAR